MLLQSSRFPANALPTVSISHHCRVKWKPPPPPRHTCANVMNSTNGPNYSRHKGAQNGKTMARQRRSDIRVTGRVCGACSQPTLRVRQASGDLQERSNIHHSEQRCRGDSQSAVLFLQLCSFSFDGVHFVAFAAPFIQMQTFAKRPRVLFVFCFIHLIYKFLPFPLRWRDGGNTEEGQKFEAFERLHCRYIDASPCGLWAVTRGRT